MHNGSLFFMHIIARNVCSNEKKTFTNTVQNIVYLLKVFIVERTYIFLFLLIYWKIAKIMFNILEKSSLFKNMNKDAFSKLIKYTLFLRK